MPKKLRVFFDTSALLAGLNSPYGAAGTIIAQCLASEIIPVIAPQVIEEAEVNIVKKFPKLKDGWTSFLLIPPEITKRPSVKEIIRAYLILLLLRPFEKRDSSAILSRFSTASFFLRPSQQRPLPPLIFTG